MPTFPEVTDTLLRCGWGHNRQTAKVTVAVKATAIAAAVSPRPRYYRSYGRPCLRVTSRQCACATQGALVTARYPRPQGRTRRHDVGGRNTVLLQQLRPRAALLSRPWLSRTKDDMRRYMEADLV